MNYPCVLCGRHFGSAAAAQQHQRDSPSHATSSSVEILNRSSGSGVPPQHIRHDSPAELETFKCGTCGRPFGSAQALEQHKRDTPSHSKSFTCGICKRSYRSEDALKMHMRDSPAHLKRVDCLVCERTFGSAEALNQHRRDAHDIVKTSKEPAKSDTETPPSSQNTGLSSATSHSAETDMSVLMSSLSLQQQASARPLTQSADKAPSKKTKKMLRDPDEEKRTFFTFPNLHERVRDAIFPDVGSTWFQDDDRSTGFLEQYTSNVSGHFTCNNKTCRKHQWSSGVVTFRIRGYARNGYSASVFNQRCRDCNHLGSFSLDEQSYVERVAYRVKKWAGVAMARPYYNPVGPQGPHEEDFCEGCALGICVRQTAIMQRLR